MTHPPYCCPRTGRALVRRGDALETQDGSSSYPLRHGVPDFRLTAPPDPADEQEIAERDGRVGRS